ncbi:MAG: TetR/AcrR family transcriptional regulator [Bacteroidota bacterium]
MAKKISTEEKILESAQKVFHNKGFAGTRMQEIADTAEINKGLLHYYFKSKEKLFESVFNIALKQMLGRLNTTLGENVDLFTKIEKLVDSYISVLSKNTFIPNFIFHEINRNPDFFNEKVKTLNNLEGIKIFENQIREETEKGTIIEINPKQLIINIISMSIFPFIAKPMAMGILEISKKEFSKIIEERKKLVAEFTISAIKK